MQPLVVRTPCMLWPYNNLFPSKYALTRVQEVLVGE